MSDSISRQAAIDRLTEYGNGRAVFISVGEAIIRIEQLPPAQLGTNLAEVGTDCISRQVAIDVLEEQIAYCDKALKTFGISMKDEYAVKVEKASLVAYKEQLEAIPAVQPEPLTDKEQRIFLAAMERERKVCKEVDDQYVHEPYEVLLTKVCDEIKRKVKKVLWT